MEPSAPKQLGRYRITREIGRGAMGIVYLATDPVIGRPVAIKTVALPPDLEDARRRECLERAAREAKAAGLLSHPSIVTVYDAGRDGDSGLFFIAMEHVQGETLKQEIAARGALREERALHIARSIAGALAHAHARGVVHRDIKPANILLGQDGSVKIADFGVARMDASDLTKEGQSIGSPAYMSPEQVIGRPAEARSDLFSLGVLLYEMLTGRKPFAAPDAHTVTYHIVHTDAIPLREINDEVSPAWEAVVSRLLAKRPGDRFPDADALLEDLKKLDDSAAGSGGQAAGSGGQAAGSGGQAAGSGGQATGAPRRVKVAADRAIAPETRARAWSAAQGLWVGLRRGGPRLARALPRPGALVRQVAGRKPAIAAAAGLLVLLAVVRAPSLFSAGCRVEVEMKHGLGSGRLRIEVDGGTVLDRRFEGDRQWPGPFGRKRVRGSMADAFHVGPGEREVVVRVDGDHGSGSWSQRIHRKFEEGTGAVLEIRVATTFSKGLSLDWSSTARGARD